MTTGIYKVAITLIKTTQGEQVAGELEKQIKGGRIALGCRMPSTRELALQFDVSRQVIESAFEMLEKRLLIVRKPRIGTYVNPESMTKCRMDLCLLRLQTGKRLIDYTEKLLSLSNSDVWNGCNLSIRSSSESNYSLGILRYELEKICHIHLNCLLVLIPGMDVKTLNEFKHLPFPVVFLGDILPDCKLDRVWSQIAEATTDRARAMVNIAADYGYRHAVLIGGPLNKYYCRVMKQAGEQTAQERGIAFRYVELEENTCRTEDELIALRATHIRKVLAEGPVDVLLLDGYRQLDLFIQPLLQAGRRLHEDIDLIADGELCPGTIFIQSDYTELSLEILHRISQFLSAPERSLGKVVIADKIKRSPLKIDWDWNQYTHPKRRS